MTTVLGLGTSKCPRTTSKANTGKSVTPRTCRLHNNVVIPYEFSFATEDTNIDEDFIKRSLPLFAKHSVDVVFGIRVLAQDDDKVHLEVTEDRVNMMISRDLNASQDDIKAL